MKQLSKRIFWLILAAMMLTAMLAGCTGETEPKTTEVPQSNDKENHDTYSTNT